MGYIGIDRGIRKHWIYQDSCYFHVWFEMLHCARFSKEPATELVEKQLVEIQYSKFIFGRKKWSERLGVSEQKLRTLIKKLIEDDMIELTSRYNKFSLYRIKNYEKYNHQNNQQDNHPKGQEPQGESDSGEVGNNQHNNQQVTSNQPADNQQITTKEECINKDKTKNLKQSSYSDVFEQFWTTYPRKESKKRAYACWQSRLKHESPLNLIRAAENYAAKCKRENTETRFIKHPSTFLSAKQDYEDYLETNIIPFDNSEAIRQRKLDETRKLIEKYDQRAEEARAAPPPDFKEIRRKIFGHRTS